MPSLCDLPDEILLSILNYDLSLIDLILFAHAFPQYRYLAFRVFYQVITIDPFKSESQGINPLNVFQSSTQDEIPETYLNFIKLHGEHILRRMTGWQYLEFYREYGPIVRRLRFVQLSDMLLMHRLHPFLLKTCILEFPSKSITQLNSSLPEYAELYRVEASQSSIPTYMDIVAAGSQELLDETFTLEEPMNMDVQLSEYEPSIKASSIIMDQFERRLHRVKLPNCVLSLEVAVSRDDSCVLFADKVSVPSCTNLTKLIVRVKKLTWDFGSTPHLTYFEFFGKELDVINTKANNPKWEANLVEELNLTIQTRTNWHLSHFPKLCQLYLELDRDVVFEQPLGSLSQCKCLRIIQLQLMCGYLPFLPELPTHIKILFVWCLKHIEFDISKCSELVYAYINLPKPIIKDVLESLPIPLLMTSNMTYA